MEAGHSRFSGTLPRKAFEKDYYEHYNKRDPPNCWNKITTSVDPLRKNALSRKIDSESSPNFGLLKEKHSSCKHANEYKQGIPEGFTYINYQKGQKKEHNKLLETSMLNKTVEHIPITEKPSKKSINTSFSYNINKRREASVPQQRKSHETKKNRGNENSFWNDTMGEDINNANLYVNMIKAPNPTDQNRVNSFLFEERPQRKSNQKIDNPKNIHPDNSAQFEIEWKKATQEKKNYDRRKIDVISLFFDKIIKAVPYYGKLLKEIKIEYDEEIALQKNLLGRAERSYETKIRELTLALDSSKKREDALKMQINEIKSQKIWSETQTNMMRYIKQEQENNQMIDHSDNWNGDTKNPPNKHVVVPKLDLSKIKNKFEETKHTKACSRSRDKHVASQKEDSWKNCKVNISAVCENPHVLQECYTNGIPLRNEKHRHDSKKRGKSEKQI